MSAVEAAPPPPRPPPPSGTQRSQRGGTNLQAGLSMDLESVKFNDSPSEYDFRKRSHTLGSRPTSHHMERLAQEPHVIDPRSCHTERPTHKPHMIDSSGRGTKSNVKIEEQHKSIAPAPKPNRPPPPKAIHRSVSQPASLTTRVGQLEEGVVNGREVDGGPVLRRRLSSEGSMGSSSSSRSLRSLSPRRSRELTPLPQLPEDAPATATPTNTTPILTPPSKLSPPHGTFSSGPPTTSSAMPPQHASISPPPSGPLPPVPKRSRAMSSPPRTTPPPRAAPESNPFSDNAPKSASPTKKNSLQSPAHLKQTTPTQDVTPQEDSVVPASESSEPAPVIPPRPFRPPRPYPPSANTKSPQRKPRPNTAPSRSNKELSSPVHPSRRSPRHKAQAHLMEASSTLEDDPREKVKLAGDEHPRTGPVGTTSPPQFPARAKSSPARRAQKTSARDPKADQSHSQSHDQSHDQSKPSPTPPSPPPSSPSLSDLPTVQKSPEKVETAPEKQGLSPEPAAAEQREVVRRLESNDHPWLVPPSGLSTYKGQKFMNSMKNSFRSLRLKTKKSPDTLRTKRAHSNSHVNKYYPDPIPPGIIHPIIVQCVAYLNRETVLVEEGLFRVPGDLAVIRRLRHQFIEGYEVDLMEVLDPHTVAGLLKLHFREMKASLIPRGPPLIQLMTHVKSQDVEAVRGEFEELEVSSVATLSIVIEVLVKIAAHSDVNYMTSGIIATSCGPSLFPYLPPSNANQMTKFLIDNCSSVFKSN